MGLFDLAKNAVIEKFMPKPKTLEEQRIENLTKIAENIHEYFLVQTQNKVPSLYANNKSDCIITMAKDLCIPKEIDYPNDELSYHAQNGAYEAMQKLKIEANIFRLEYGTKHSECVIKVDWS